MNEFVQKILSGDHRSIARLISLVENDDATAIEPMKLIHTHTGKALVIGITGVMGSGKSSLIYELAVAYRKQGKKVGVIAIDPTSPFTGGALLGDRVRMMDLATDEGIFIRSMGTRGMMGGLTGAVYATVSILDAAGMDVIIIETVGVGQDEIDIVKVADTTLVVLVPGLGDSVQTIKAGLMEIADIFIVNKMDRPGADQTVYELESLIDLMKSDQREIPIVKTSALEKKGVDVLVDEINQHMMYLKDHGEFDKKRWKRYEAELVELIRRRLMNLIFDESIVQNRINHFIEQIAKKQQDPYSAADEILGTLVK